MIFRVLIPLAPIGQSRPKFSTRHGVMRTYDPKKSGDWKKTAAFYIFKAMGEQGFKSTPFPKGPLSVVIVAVFPALKTTRPQRRRLKDTRPDLDNVEKGILDAAKALWKDDAQVAIKHSTKFVGATGEAPHVILQIEDAPPVTHL